MTESTSKSVDQSATFHNWYVRSAKTYNEQRRERYAASASVRKKAQRRAKRYKKMAEPMSGLATESRLVYLPDGSRVTAYTTGHLAAAVDRTAETIRQWEKRGLIPPPTVPGGKRVYLKHQRALVKELAALLKKPATKAELAEFLIQMQKDW